MRVKVAVIIPVYNEAQNIRRVLQELSIVQDSLKEWEIHPIIVNDGSTDQTGNILTELESSMKHQTLSFSKNQGIGRAFQAGVASGLAWGADVVLQLDGDGQHRPDQISRIVLPILEGRADVCVGSRYLLGGSGRVSTRMRRLGTWVFSKILGFFFGIQVYDSTSGFRAFNREAAQLICERYSPDYPEVEAYIDFKLKRFRVFETAVQMRPRTQGVSSIRFPRNILYVLKVGARLMLRSLMIE